MRRLSQHQSTHCKRINMQKEKGFLGSCGSFNLFRVSKKQLIMKESHFTIYSQNNKSLSKLYIVNRYYMVCGSACSLGLRHSLLSYNEYMENLFCRTESLNQGWCIYMQPNVELNCSSTCSLQHCSSFLLRFSRASLKSLFCLLVIAGRVQKVIMYRAVPYTQPAEWQSRIYEFHMEHERVYYCGICIDIQPYLSCTVGSLVLCLYMCCFRILLYIVRWS